MGYIINYEIEKNLPIPKQERKRGEIAGFLKTLEVGDSFKYTDDANKKSTQISLKYHARQADIRLTVRKTGEGQYRAWRIA